MLVMKFLRTLSVIVLILCIANIFVLAYASLRIPCLWLLVIGQMFACYAGVEIVHTMFQKPKMPVPTSLAFQKEIISRFQV
jgi:hypothetical protein